MKTAQELLKKLIEFNDVKSATAIWSEANAIIKEYNDVKRACRALIERHLRKTGEAKGKTETASYGWTQPKPKMQLNEKAWEDALLNDDNLYDLAFALERRQRQMKKAQEPYMEEIYPSPRVYIK